MRHAFRILQALCLGLSFAAVADGAPTVDLSRTTEIAVLSRLALNTGVSLYDDQLIRITNVGTDPLDIGMVTFDESVDFRLIASCVGTLAPAQGCSLIVRFVDSNSFYINTRLNIFSNAGDSPHSVPLAGLTSYPFEFRSFPLATPSYLDFGTASVGAPTASSRIEIRNAGAGADSNLTAITVGGRHPSDFSVAGSCHAGTVLATNATCSLDVTFVPAAPGPRSAEIYLTDSGYSVVRLSLALVGYGVGARPTAQAVEFYHQQLDHYFLTHIAAEIAKLDAGTEIKGWTRTGQSITVATASDSETSPVCRFYIPPGLGNSHFYGRGSAECTSTGQKNPSFVNEDPQFFHMVLPAAGVCPAGTSQVYRVFSNRADANHRYMKDKAIRDQMVAKGWLAEGDGTDLVVMCAPA